MALNMFTRIIQPFRLLLSLEHIMYKKVAADQLLMIVELLIFIMSAYTKRQCYEKTCEKACVHFTPPALR